MRKRATWLRHLEAMFTGGSLRRLAAELDVTPRTVARWRKRLMRLMNDAPRCRCAGRVQAMSFRPYYSPWMQLMVLADDEGRASAVLLPTRPTPADVADAFRRYTRPGSVIVLGSAPRGSVLVRGAQAAGLARESGDVDAALRYAHSLKRWLRRFHGTTYTDGYLAWFDAVQSLPAAARFGAHWAAEAEVTPHRR